MQSLTGDRLPIMRKAVRVESKRNAILFVGAAGMLRLLTLAVSATKTLKNINAWNTNCIILKLKIKASANEMGLQGPSQTMSLTKIVYI